MSGKKSNSSGGISITTKNSSNKTSNKTAYQVSNQMPKQMPNQMIQNWINQNLLSATRTKKINRNK